MCGAVRYEIEPPLRPIIQCHCGQCARWTGHLVAATQVSAERFALRSGSDELTWYRSSDRAERGFCRSCGSSLFWRQHDGQNVSILAGTLDQPTGLRTAVHIFVGDKADYYEIGEADRAPQVERWITKEELSGYLTRCEPAAHRSC